MPLLLATSFSMPVATRAGSVTRSGTAWRCMFGTHESPIGVVVFQERDQARRYPNHLLGRNVDVLYLVGIDVAEIASEPSDDAVGGYFVTFCLRVGRRQVSKRFLVGAQLANAVGELAFCTARYGVMRKPYSSTPA